MDVSIIIVNYNTCQLLVDCLETIYKYTEKVNFEIIIIDNNSPDRSIENIKSKFPDVKLILHNENVGFGGANNLGANIAQGEFLFFLNPDTLLLNNSVKFFVDFCRRNENTLRIGAVGSVLLDKNKNINGSYSEQYSTLLDEIMISLKSTFSTLERQEKFLQEDYKAVAWVSGADLFVKKDIFFEINKFDENIFMYYEEIDLQKRLNAIGLLNYIIKEPKIIHLEGGSFDEKMSIRKKKIVDTSRLYFYKKYSGNRLSFFINRKLFIVLTYLKVFKQYGKQEALNYLKFLKSL